MNQTQDLFLLMHSIRSALAREGTNVTNILGHAARLACLDPDSFPTVYDPSTDRFPDSQLGIASLLAQLPGMVNNLGTTLTALAD